MPSPFKPYQSMLSVNGALLVLVTGLLILDSTDKLRYYPAILLLMAFGILLNLVMCVGTSNEKAPYFVVCLCYGVILAFAAFLVGAVAL